MTNSLTFTHFFDAAHQLPDSETLTTKQCANLHGHTYKVIVEVSSTALKDGMIVDFGRIKSAINVLDHHYINDVFAENPFWKDVPPTAENIATFIFEVVQAILPDFAKVDAVGVNEGYKGEDRANYAWTNA